MSEPESLDVAVAGTGPAGLAAALVLGRAARRCVLVDAGPGTQRAGRQRARLPRPRRISGTRDAFVLELASGSEYQVRRVVLATGVVDDLLAIDGIERLWGRTVVHCPYCHGWDLREQPTAVRASSSLDVLLALKVAHLSEDVIVCLNGGPALSPNDDAMLKSAGIAVRPEPIIRIEAEGDQLQRIVSPTATAWSGLCFTCIPPFAQLQRSRPTWVAGSSTTASSRSTMIGDYVVDGHVPAEAIARLFEERPAVDGIALPGMPAGSLGMSGDKTDAFEIVSFKDGGVQPYISV